MFAYCLNIYTVPSEELAAHPSVARHNRQIITPVKHTNIQHTYMPLTKCIWVVPIQGDIMYNLQNDNKNRHVGVGPRIRGCQKRGLILKWNTYPIFFRYNDAIACLNKHLIFTILQYSNLKCCNLILKSSMTFLLLCIKQKVWN